MSFTDDITLAALAARTTSGTGTAVDTTFYRLARLILYVSACSNGSALKVTVQASKDGVIWAALWMSPEINSATSIEFTVPDLPMNGKIRVLWTQSGPATFEVSGELVQSYASSKELYRHAIPASGLTGVELVDIVEELVTQSEVADGYLAGKYTMPLIAWGGDLTSRICHMAEYSLITTRGMNPDGDTYTIIKDKYDAAIKWLSDVAAGKIKSPAIVDSAEPATTAGGAAVTVTSTLRGW